MRRKGWLAVGAVAVVVLAGGAAAFLWLRAGSSPPARTTPTGGAPRAAITAIQRLTSSRESVQRSAMTPALASLLPPGRLLPPGTTFTPSPHSWHQSGAFANITGTLAEPGHRSVRTVIGLMLRHGRWYVTFEEPQT